MSASIPYIETELLRKIAEGDEAAFSILFDKYHVRVFDYLVVITKAKEAAEELLMDIFLKLWLGREWITEIKDVEAFLKKVAYNKAIDFIRYTARHKKLQDIIAREVAYTPGQSPVDTLAEKDYQKIIQKAVDGLSPQRRQVYTLSRSHGLTHDEIAHELNLSVSTVKNHSKAALKSIKAFLKENNISGITFLLFFLQH
ncbi:MAG: RNA polymerase sigma-70 factor [Chitinophagaceae bacterium]|nr:RNA polymerase sigma-70 factor [Chitinophagaceae bacterium]